MMARKHEMRMVAYSRAVSKDKLWFVHREGCQDIKRDVAQSWAQKVGTFDTVGEALVELIDTEMIEMGYTVEDVQVYPCTR